VSILCFVGCAGTTSSGNLGNNSKASPASITGQPVNQSVTVGQTATFAVTATGTAPITYQWRKNGAATAASYTTPATSLSDNGAKFDVIVSNSVGSVTSSSAHARS